MRYLSVCSGIEAATVAWNPLGWKPVAFAEIERFPSAVLAHHYPNTPNLGDMTKLPDVGPIDLLVGGTPCQSFSVAGLRGGMADARGNLALVYLRLADRMRPRWIVWENVPGVLSSNGGRDFGAFLGGLAQIGYGFAYRVLDAQFFGLAQRRKRVFVVGCLGDWRRAAAVLLERSGVCWDPPPSRAERKTAPTLTSRSSAGDFDYDGGLIVNALTERPDRGGGNSEGQRLIAHSLNAHRSRIDGKSETFVTFNARQDVSVSVSVSDSLGSRDTGHGLATRSGVRRLTPRECERLQGFPDDYTAITGAKDGPRYKALGNSMAVSCMAWIGERIAARASAPRSGEEPERSVSTVRVDTSKAEGEKHE